MRVLLARCVVVTGKRARRDRNYGLRISSCCSKMWYTADVVEGEGEGEVGSRARREVRNGWTNNSVIELTDA